MSHLKQLHKIVTYKKLFYNNYYIKYIKDEMLVYDGLFVTA